MLDPSRCRFDHALILLAPLRRNGGGPACALQRLCGATEVLWQDSACVHVAAARRLLIFLGRRTSTRPAATPSWHPSLHTAAWSAAATPSPGPAPHSAATTVRSCMVLLCRPVPCCVTAVFMRRWVGSSSSRDLAAVDPPHFQRTLVLLVAG